MMIISTVSLVNFVEVERHARIFLNPANYYHILASSYYFNSCTALYNASQVECK